MQTDNRILDDIARLASGALGVASSAREETEALIRARLQRLFAEMDLVTREEFEAVQAMAAQARADQEALAARVAALEKTAQGGKGGAKPRAAKGRGKAAPKA